MKVSNLITLFVSLLVFSTFSFADNVRFYGQVPVKTGTVQLFDTLSEQNVTFVYLRKPHNLMYMGESYTPVQICEMAKQHNAFVNVVIHYELDEQYVCNSREK